MYKRILYLVLAVSIFMVVCKECWGYNGKEHAAIDDWILEHAVGGFDLDQYVRHSLGIDRGMKDKCIRYVNILDWLTIIDYKSPQELIAQGGKEEDSPFWRCINHFHDPLSPWDQAGLTILSGESSVLWAQKDTGGQSWWYGGSYTWHDARDSFYKALTGTDAGQRNSDLSSTFLAVGHLMHLIQDSSCPEHVRNDSHGVNKSVYEKLLTYYNDKKKRVEYPKFQGWLQSGQDHVYPFFNALSPQSMLGLDSLPANARIPIARMVDTDWYIGSNPDVTVNPLIGLAEYTNANFLSQNRIFEGYDYPNKDTSVTKELYEIADPRDNGSTIQREYLKKTGDGATGYRLSTTSITGAYQVDLSDPVKVYRVSALDDNVLEDYAAQLVPRGESYSAALLKYFFRGTMEISLPGDGVYAFRDTEPANPVTQGFNRVRLLVRNTTGTGERMLGGEIDLVVQYRFLTDRANPADPAACSKNPLINETYADLSHFYYSQPLCIVKKYAGVASGEIITPDAPVLLEFDLGDKEIPLWAVDVRFSVVYKGKLGRDGDGEYVEQDAVCVGYKDVCEPTPVVFANSLDIFCYDNAWWYDLNVKANLDTLKDTYKNNPCIQSMAADDLLNLDIKFSPKGMTPGTTPYRTINRIGPGQYKRMYLITDYDATLNYSSPSYAQGNNTENDIGLRNGPMSENDTLTWWYPGFPTYRGIEQWTGSFLVQECASCLNGSDCTECDDSAIDENEDLVPMDAAVP
jgi:hypothetical protein